MAATMDAFLFNLLDKKVEKINPIIGRGISNVQMQDALSYYRRVVMQIEKGFIPGLKFVSCVRCAPREEIEKNLTTPPNRNEYETAKSDFYMIKLQLSYNDVLLQPHYLYLPFTRDAGIINIRGSRFGITPVLIDRAFSVDNGNLFIPFTRDKLTFRRIGHAYMSNGKRITRPVVVSLIYKPSHKYIPKPGQTGMPALVTYLLADYGVSKMLNVIGKVPYDAMRIGFGDIPIEEPLPATEWVVMRSTRLKPMGWPKTKNAIHTPPTVYIAIRENFRTLLVSDLLTGIFYVLDHHAARVEDLEDLEDPVTWKRILGIQYDGHKLASNRPEVRIIEGIEDHLNSVRDYIDDMVAKTLMNEGILCETINDFFVYVIQNMTKHIIKAEPSNIYGKKLVTLDYVMLHLTKDLFKFLFTLQALNKAKGEVSLTEMDITKIMRKKILSETAFGINKAEHCEVQPCGIPNDTALPTLTSRMLPQNKATGKSKRGSANDQTTLLNASWATGLGITVQPKKEPSGCGSLSIYTELSPMYEIVPHKDKYVRAIVKDLEYALKNKLPKEKL